MVRLDEKTQYWLELAEYDLETARIMFKNGRFLYVGFMCHQVVEKALKAVITNQGSIPPFIHNLAKLAERAGLYQKLTDEQKDMLSALDPLNIQARYPEDKDRVFATLSLDRCKTTLSQAQEFYDWIKATL